MLDVMTCPKEQIFSELRAQLAPGTVLRPDEPLAKKTTLRVGGCADVYVEPTSENDLARVVLFCHEREVPLMILGRGSNLLIRDGGIRGVVVCLAHANFSKIEIVGQQLHCGAGAKLKNVSIEARRNNLSGLEFLEGIPGSVGGALRMNAGAMGGTLAVRLALSGQTVTVVDQGAHLEAIQRNGLKLVRADGAEEVAKD